jgi:hypothetical protein
MPAVKRIPVEINFENKIFDFYTDNDGYPQFDFYLLKSKPNVLTFEFDGCDVKIFTSKFPTNQFGAGYLIDSRIIVNNDEGNGKCYASGPGGSRSFKTEFDAQIAIISYVLKSCLISGTWHSQGIKKLLQEFINPKTLF